MLKDHEKNKDLKIYNKTRSGMQGFDTSQDSYIKRITGLTIYLTIFGVIIPYFLIKFNLDFILAAYMPNLDLIANVIGYSKGPYMIFGDLYNSDTVELRTIIINYFALLFLFYFILEASVKKGSVFYGLSRASIMILLTYLAPGNILAYSLYYIGKTFDPFFKIGSITNWFVTVLCGFILVTNLIFIEAIIINNFGQIIYRLMKATNKFIRQL